MIIKQYQDVIDERKTQTRRAVKPEQYCQIRLQNGKTILAASTDLHNERPSGHIVAVGKISKSGAFRPQYRVGSTYAIVPKRGHHALWVMEAADGTYTLHTDINPMTGQTYLHFYQKEYWLLPGEAEAHLRHIKEGDWKTLMRCEGWKQARIRIECIVHESVSDISAADCLAEGLIEIEVGKPSPGEWHPAWAYDLKDIYSQHMPQHLGTRYALKSAYRRLWDSINKSKPYRWIDSPSVWVYTFKRVFE